MVCESVFLVLRSAARAWVRCTGSAWSARCRRVAAYVCLRPAHSLPLFPFPFPLRTRPNTHDRARSCVPLLIVCCTCNWVFLLRSGLPPPIEQTPFAPQRLPPVPRASTDRQIRLRSHKPRSTACCCSDHRIRANAVVGRATSGRSARRWSVETSVAESAPSNDDLRAHRQSIST